MFTVRKEELIWTDSIEPLDSLAPNFKKYKQN